MAELYTCARCGGIFEKAWSDEEAAKELAERFTVGSGEELVVVCDDCDKIMWERYMRHLADGGRPF